MPENLLEHPTALKRHREAPLLKEREEFLGRLQQQGTSRAALRNLSGELIHPATLQISVQRSSADREPTRTRAASQSFMVPSVRSPLWISFLQAFIFVSHCCNRAPTTLACAWFVCTRLRRISRRRHFFVYCRRLPDRRKVLEYSASRKPADVEDPPQIRVLMPMLRPISFGPLCSGSAGSLPAPLAGQRSQRARRPARPQRCVESGIDGPQRKAERRIYALLLHR